MNTANNQQVLRLYKHLLKYGKQLKLTDKTLFSKRIRQEFKQNKNLTSAEEISFNFKVCFTGFTRISCLKDQI